MDNFTRQTRKEIDAITKEYNNGGDQRIIGLKLDIVERLMAARQKDLDEGRLY